MKGVAGTILTIALLLLALAVAGVAGWHWIDAVSRLNGDRGLWVERLIWTVIAFMLLPMLCAVPAVFLLVRGLVTPVPTPKGTLAGLILSAMALVLLLSPSFTLAGMVVAVAVLLVVRSKGRRVPFDPAGPGAPRLI